LAPIVSLPWVSCSPKLKTFLCTVLNGFPMILFRTPVHKYNKLRFLVSKELKAKAGATFAIFETHLLKIAIASKARILEAS
jgi:hypothetical protein